jgi:hypothetical protein
MLSCVVNLKGKLKHINVNIKYQLCFKNIVYSKPNVSDLGLRTWIQVTLNDMLHCGRGYMSFDSHKTKGNSLSTAGVEIYFVTFLSLTLVDGN